MKVLVIPDIHLKPDIIKKASNIMISKKCDIAVFLGDFCDDWNKGLYIGLYEETFETLGEFLKAYPNTLICYGNHDLSYIWQLSETGYSSFARDTVMIQLRNLYQKYGIDRWKYIHHIDNLIFSHAGISRDFMRWYFKNDTKQSILKDLDLVINQINYMGKKELWEDMAPIWARPKDCEYYIFDNMIQVIGHTPVERNVFHHIDSTLMTDVFSTYSNGYPIGNQKFVIIDSITKRWKEV